MLRRLMHPQAGRRVRVSAVSRRSLLPQQRRRQFATQPPSSTSAADPLRPSVLVVNHGFPPLFNAGSEVYAQTLAHGLAASGRCAAVSVLAREHNPFEADYRVRELRSEATRAGRNDTLTHVPLRLLNHPREVPYTRFVNADIRARFEDVLRATRPNVVSFQHLNHLSLDLPAAAKAAGAATVYTLHDMWLTLCPRGQLVVCGAARDGSGDEPYALCDGQNNRKCADKCYTNRFGTGAANTQTAEAAYWEQWIAARMEAARSAVANIDLFVAPSQHLYDLVTAGSPVAGPHAAPIKIPKEKVVLLPYGFNRRALSGRNRHRKPGEPFVFGYIGRHSATKGIHLLLEAAARLVAEQKQQLPDASPTFKVLVFGRPDATTWHALKDLTAAAGSAVEWCGEYDNRAIVSAVFDRVDAIVVPSIWEENAPLVIHEAQQLKVPVITAARGGMGELVRDGVNGLTFDFRNATSLAAAMRRALHNPAALDALGRRGYLASRDGQVPCIDEHISTTIGHYRRLLRERQPKSAIAATTLTLDDAIKASKQTSCASASAPKPFAEQLLDANRARPAPLTPQPFPWRITFDTNPDDCNFHCLMCEQHSSFSTAQTERKARKERARRMDFDVIANTVRDGAPRGLKEIIPTTMGEPLMYKDRKGRSLKDVIQLCEEMGVRLNLTTNGSFHSHLGLSVEQWAALLLPVLSDVKFSWNSADGTLNEHIMAGSKWETQLHNLKTFRKARDEYAQAGNRRSTITLQCTFMRRSASKLPELARFAIVNGVDRLKGHHLWAHFEQIKADDMRHSEESVREWNAIAAECHRIAVATPLPNGKRLELVNFEPLSVSTSKTGGELHPEATCPFLGREAWVNAKGEFNPCCAPDEQRKALGTFGFVSTDGMLSIWNSSEYKALLRDYDRHPLCRGCSLRKPPSVGATTQSATAPASQS